MSKNERLTKLEVEAIAENVIGWCMKNYGISEKYSTIYLDVFYCDKPHQQLVWDVFVEVQKSFSKFNQSL